MTETQEIERKFLVKNDDWKDQTYDSFNIKHAYIVNIPEVSLRLTIRTKSNTGLYAQKACINIKTPRDGLVRFETELELDPLVGENLFDSLSKADVDTIQKTRYLVSCGDWTYGYGPVWEIDSFHTPGLENIVLAELEIPEEKWDIEKPNWLGQEVTNDPQYCNAIMAASDHTGRPSLTGEEIDKNFMDNWTFLLNSDGSVNLDLLKYELFDFSHLIREVPKIYNHIAGLSKHMYYADTIIREADRRYWELHRDIILDDIQGMDVEEIHEYLRNSG